MWGDPVELDSKEICSEDLEWTRSDLGQATEECGCERGNEPSGSLKRGNFLW